MASNERAQEAEDLLAVLKLIAERAGKEILAYYVEGAEGDGPAVREKADSTPVTEADEAAEAFTVAVARKPGDRDLLILLAQASFDAGEVDEAFELVRTWALDNTDAGAWLVLADFARRSNDPDTARDAIMRSIEIDPEGGPEAYLASADLERSLGENATALRRLRQAYGLAPEDPAIADLLRSYGEVPGPTLVLPPGP